MEEYVVEIFLASFAGIVLSFGAWVVRGFNRDFVVTKWSVHARVPNPGAYWFWVVWHVAGLVIVWTVAVGVAAEAVLSLL